jgi:hypothetical protein
MQVCSAVSHISAGVWVRNGFSVLQQVEVYNTMCHESMREPDWLSLQLSMCSISDHNTFIMQLLTQFGLISFWDNKVTVPAVGSIPIAMQIERMIGSDPSVDKRKTSLIAEAALELLVRLVSHRSGPSGSSQVGANIDSGVGVLNSFQRTRAEVVHALAVKPMPFSALLKLLGDKSATAAAELEQVLSEVAKVIPASAQDDTKYTLKRNCFLEGFDPYWYRLSLVDRQSAEQNYFSALETPSKLKKLSNSPAFQFDVSAKYPPMAPQLFPLHASFSRIPQVLSSGLLAFIWYRVVCAATKALATAEDEDSDVDEQLSSNRESDRVESESAAGAPSTSRKKSRIQPTLVKGLTEQWTEPMLDHCLRLMVLGVQELVIGDCPQHTDANSYESETIPAFSSAAEFQQLASKCRDEASAAVRKQQEASQLSYSIELNELLANPVVPESNETRRESFNNAARQFIGNFAIAFGADQFSGSRTLIRSLVKLLSRSRRQPVSKSKKSKNSAAAAAAATAPAAATSKTSEPVLRVRIATLEWLIDRLCTKEPMLRMFGRVEELSFPGQNVRRGKFLNFRIIS